MIIEFGILGVPINWSNFYVNRFVMYEKKKEWLEDTIILGRMARIKAGCAVAEKGHDPRILRIHQLRTRFLDKDGLYISAKPIVDGLKTKLRKKIDGKMTSYEGAGLIFNDNPDHCDWEVIQEKADGREQKTTIQIEIP